MRRHRPSLRTSVAVLAGLTLAPACGLVLGMPSAVAASPITFSSGRPAATARAGVTITIGDGSTPVAQPKAPVTVSGTITNNTASRIAAPTVDVSIAGQVLDTAGLLSEWESGELRANLTSVGSTKLADIAPGQSVPYVVTIPAAHLTYSYGLAALPMSIGVHSAGKTAGTQRTTLVWQSATKLQAPIRTAFIVPLGLPADPALFGPTGQQRTAAWQAAIGPGSRVDRLLSQLSGLPITWVVDPTLVDPPAPADADLPPIPPAPTSSSSSSSSVASSPSGSSSAAAGSSSGSAGNSSSTGSSASTTSTPAPSTAEGTSGTASHPGSTTGSSTGSSSTSSGASSSSPSSSASSSASSPTPTGPSDVVANLVGNLRNRLAALNTNQRLWWTPYGDPDLSALTSSKDGQQVAGRMISRPLPTQLRAISPTVVAWPAETPSAATLKNLQTEWTSAAHTKPVVLASALSIDNQGVPLGSAGRHTNGTSAVLTFDDAASRLLTAPGDPGLRGQRLLADTIALYQQRPGSNRSLALAVPRDAVAAPEQLAQIIKETTSAGWLAPTTADALLKGSLPQANVLGTPAKGRNQAPRSPLTSSVLLTVADERTDLATITSLVVDPGAIVDDRGRLVDMAASTRWRGHAPALGEAVKASADALRGILGKVQVTPSSINFFTDTGQVVVTVTNDLSRPVHGVRVSLEPRKYLLRVKRQPDPVDLRANSRASVRATVVAIGAGEVPVDAVLEAPNGTMIGKQPPSQLKLNVRPTATWMYGVLGILAALVLVIGVIRSVRRGPRRDEVQPLDPTPTGDETIVATDLPQHVNDRDESPTDTKDGPDDE